MTFTALGLQAMTKEQITSQYALVCQQLGQLVLQRMDGQENLASLDGQIANLREQAKQLSKDFQAAAVQGDKGEQPVSTPAS